MSKLIGLIGAAVLGLAVVGIIIGTGGDAIIWFGVLLVFAAIGSMVIKFFQS